jgi:hypothetical protein
MKNKWMGKGGLWDTESYQQNKKENFEILDKFLVTPPMKILDIGCGLAWESRLFNEKYNSELWLLDGDTRDNESKSPKARAEKYHTSADEFLFYHPLSEVDAELKKLGTKNYHLIDCNNIDISENVKFDLITSWVSCGFHYPVNTYRDLILKHSHAGTRVVMDLRVMYKKTNMPEREDGVEILKVIAQRKKFIMTELKLS